MATVLHHYRITEQSFPDPYGFNFDVQVYNSVDGGVTYWYCGIGKFTKTLPEAFAYCENYEQDHGAGDPIAWTKAAHPIFDGGICYTSFSEEARPEC